MSEGHGIGVSGNVTNLHWPPGRMTREADSQCTLQTPLAKNGRHMQEGDQW